MKLFLTIAAFLAITLTGCTTKQYVPQDMQARLKVDRERELSIMTDDELRIHFNDLNNFRTAMEMGARSAEPIERIDYEQHLRWIEPRLQHVEIEMDRRRYSTNATADTRSTAAEESSTLDEPGH